MLRGLGWVIAAAVLIALPFVSIRVGQPALVGLMTQILIYSIAAMSLNLILGYGGMVSFGHAAFFGVGGYVVGILYFHFAESSEFIGLVPGTNAFLVAVPAAVVMARWQPQ